VNDREPRDIAVKKCSLCGGPNDCALARGAADPANPCWCVERSFPEPLLARARARDGGAACICRACLDVDVSVGSTSDTKKTTPR